MNDADQSHYIKSNNAQKGAVDHIINHIMPERDYSRFDHKQNSCSYPNAP